MANPDIIYKNLALELKQIEDAIRELKLEQFTGTDTVHTYVNQTGNWDIDYTPTFSLPTTAVTKEFSILFSANEQPAPVNKLRYIVLIDNTYYYTVTGFDYKPTPFDIFVFGVHDTALSYANRLPEPKLDGWLLSIIAYRSGMNIKVKIIIDITDTGTISSQEI